ncbi:MAG TPA: DUF2336 domain-containing protein, partial [Phenylobacterium sp.]|nr:DUF2336 domain-containing protein [Phenylobacterium sp.]
MSTTRAALTDEDIRTLVRGATPDERAVAAHKICRNIDRAILTPAEREQAHEILRVMAADAAELVRRAISVTLKASPNVPRDVALRLARDVESISLPILSASPAFTDADLVEIVRLGGPVRQVVIAKRPRVSQQVSEAIVEQGVERAVEAVCANDNADIAERTLQKVIERFEKSERVLASVAYRQALPLSVTEKLIDSFAAGALDDDLGFQRGA